MKSSHQRPLDGILNSLKIWDGDYPEDSLIVVGEDADLTFNGDVTFYDVAHAATVLENYGTTE